MKKTTAKRKSAAVKKSHPVPEYFDEELKPVASKLDVFGRNALAEKLERQAHQLRGMQAPAPSPSKSVAIGLYPQMAKAVCAVADYYGGATMDEDEKLNCGVRWFLECSLPMVEAIIRQADSKMRYRDAEGLSDTVFSEELIRVALEAWLASQSEEEAD